MLQHIFRWLQANYFFKVFAVLAPFSVIYLSLKPPGQQMTYWTFLNFRQDLVFHFTCYFFLTGIYFAAFFKNTSVFKKAFFLSFSVGFILEFIQLISIFNRTFDFNDLLANLAGSCLGILLIRLFFSYSVK